MRIIAVSDIHGQLRTDFPAGDVLVIAGDVCPDFHGGQRFSQGQIIWDNGEQRQAKWVRESFVPWLEFMASAYGAIVFIAGNHDYVFEHGFLLPDEWPRGVVYLKDASITLEDPSNNNPEGVKFYGSPWVPNLARWAFYATDTALEARAESIPRDADVVIVHGPPRGYRDYVGPTSKQQWKYYNYQGEHVGDVPLADALLEDLRPPHLICGHIHEQHGSEWHENGDTQVYNVSQLNDQYDWVYHPVVIDV